MEPPVIDKHLSSDLNQGLEEAPAWSQQIVAPGCHGVDEQYPEWKELTDG